MWTAENTYQTIQQTSVLNYHFLLRLTWILQPRLMFYFNTKNTSCIRKLQVISWGRGHAPCTLPLHPLLDGPELWGSIRAVVYGISFISWYNMENWPLSSKTFWIIWSNVESSHAMSYPTDVFWSTIKLWWFSLLKRDCVATLFLGSITSDVSP